MKRYLQGFTAFLLLSGLVFGQATTHDFTVEVATERENGDALTFDEIERHRLACGNEPGGPYDIVVFEPDFEGESPQTVNSGEVFPEGEWFCAGQTIDTDGRVSATFGNEVNFTVGRCEVTDCRPLPPVISVTFGSQ